MDDLQHLSIEDLTQWYKTYYSPNNATLVVIGDVVTKDVIAMASKYFSDIGRSSLPKLKLGSWRVLL